MRGPKLEGMVAEGDLIRAPEPLPASGTARLETATNLTTGSTVSLARPRLGPVGKVIVALIACLFVAFFVFALCGMFSSPF
jgi:hypothetical protein